MATENPFATLGQRVQAIPAFLSQLELQERQRQEWQASLEKKGLVKKLLNEDSLLGSDLPEEFSKRIVPSIGSLIDPSLIETETGRFETTEDIGKLDISPSDKYILSLSQKGDALDTKIQYFKERLGKFQESSALVSDDKNIETRSKFWSDKIEKLEKEREKISDLQQTAFENFSKRTEIKQKETAIRKEERSGIRMTDILNENLEKGGTFNSLVELIQKNTDFLNEEDYRFLNSFANTLHQQESDFRKEASVDTQLALNTFDMKLKMIASLRQIVDDPKFKLKSIEEYEANPYISNLFRMVTGEEKLPATIKAKLKTDKDLKNILNAMIGITAISVLLQGSALGLIPTVPPKSGQPIKDYLKSIPRPTEEERERFNRGSLFIPSPSAVTSRSTTERQLSQPSEEKDFIRNFMSSNPSATKEEVEEAFNNFFQE